MNLREKMENFNKRWNVQEEESAEESFKKFKTRVLNIFKDIDNQVTEESVSLFCQLYGIEEEWKCGSSGRERWSKNIIKRLVGENNEIEFFRLIEVIFSLSIPGLSGYGNVIYNKHTLYREIQQAISFSNVNLATSIAFDKEIIFYPKGEDLLDENLVNFALSFLNDAANSHFVEGLGFFKDKKWIKVTESLRRSLEEFLRNKLGNNCGLKENISNLGKVLKDDAKPAQIRNIISVTFGHLDQYFNENSKHNDGDIGEGECEYIIYQGALLMRYIEQSIK